MTEIVNSNVVFLRYRFVLDQELDLSGCALLASVDAETLTANGDLQTLRLTNSKKLTRLPDQLLTHLPVLRHLVRPLSLPLSLSLY